MRIATRRRQSAASSPAIFIALAVALGAVNIAVAGPFDELVKHLRSDPNVLVLVEAKAARASAFYKREVLEGDAATREVRLRLFPVPNVDRAVFASEITDLEQTVPAWQMMICESARPVAMKRVADELGGKLESIGARDIVRLPSNSYLYPVSSRIVANAFPANRPQVIRALDAKPAAPPQMPAFLSETVAHASQGSYQLAMAIDLEHRVPLETAEERIRGFSSLAGSERMIPVLARIVSSLRGARLEVRFGTVAKGTITIEFGEDATRLKSVAKPLFLEVLDRNGAHLDELSAWDVSVNGNLVSFTGELSLPSLRKILSVIDLSPGVVSDSEDEPATVSAASKHSTLAQASLRYYHSVRSLLDELRDPKNTKSFSSSQNGLWYDRYAKKIDQLPLLNVDPALLEYGAEVSTRLRIQSAKFRGVGIAAGTENLNSNYWYW